MSFLTPIKKISIEIAMVKTTFRILYEQITVDWAKSKGVWADRWQPCGGRFLLIIKYQASLVFYQCCQHNLVHSVDSLIFFTVLLTELFYLMTSFRGLPQ